MTLYASAEGSNPTLLYTLLYIGNCVNSALFRCCDAPQKIKKERKGEERRERKRRKEGKEERKRRKGKEGKEERKGRKGKGKKGERKRRGKEGEVVTKVSRVDMGRA